MPLFFSRAEMGGKHMQDGSVTIERRIATAIRQGPIRDHGWMADDTPRARISVRAAQLAAPLRVLKIRVLFTTLRTGEMGIH